ncbi:MAG: hypothetical protein AVDCRST_MAG44-784, partial [uncultured Sphingomonas sp.]
ERGADRHRRTGTAGVGLARWSAQEAFSARAQPVAGAPYHVSRTATERRGGGAGAAFLPCAPAAAQGAGGRPNGSWRRCRRSHRVRRARPHPCRAGRVLPWPPHRAGQGRLAPARHDPEQGCAAGRAGTSGNAGAIVRAAAPGDQRPRVASVPWRAVGASRYLYVPRPL